MIGLPSRPGRRPRTTADIPHRQLDQTAPPDVHREVVRRFAAITETTTGPSTISVPGAIGLFLECERCGDSLAFLRGNEFAHVHPADDGSFHAVLAPSHCDRVVATGWGELHPWAVSGRIQPNVVMIYAPRSFEEVDVALGLIEASKAHALRASRSGDAIVGA